MSTKDVYALSRVCGRWRPRPDAASVSRWSAASAVVEVVTAVAEALRYLHEQSWVHRDVKPSNILYVGSVPKLGDVGTAIRPLAMP